MAQSERLVARLFSKDVCVESDEAVKIDALDEGCCRKGLVEAPAVEPDPTSASPSDGVAKLVALVVLVTVACVELVVAVALNR